MWIRLEHLLFGWFYRMRIGFQPVLREQKHFRCNTWWQLTPEWGVCQKSCNRVSNYVKTSFMKKLQLDPLQLDKKTIARLDAMQLRDIIAGAGRAYRPCPSGSSTPPPTVSGGSGACTSGSSQCYNGNVLTP